MAKEYIEAVLEAIGITNYIIRNVDNDGTYDLLIPIVNDIPLHDGRLYGMNTRRDETVSGSYFYITFKDSSEYFCKGLHWRQERE